MLAIQKVFCVRERGEGFHYGVFCYFGPRGGEGGEEGVERGGADEDVAVFVAEFGGG